MHCPSLKSFSCIKFHCTKTYYFGIIGFDVFQATTFHINIESPILTTCILSSVKNTFRISPEWQIKFYIKNV